MLKKGATIYVVVLFSTAVAVQYQRAADGTASKSERAADIARSQREICYAHLLKISAALMKYRKDHNGRLPRDLVPFVTPTKVLLGETDTLFPRYIKSMDTLVCPARVAFGNVPLGKSTYVYCIRPWVRELPFDSEYLSSHQFYNQIVPERGNGIRLVMCMEHPTHRAKRLCIMWDGSIQEQQWPYDPFYGRAGKPRSEIEQAQIKQQAEPQIDNLPQMPRLPDLRRGEILADDESFGFE